MKINNSLLPALVVMILLALPLFSKVQSEKKLSYHSLVVKRDIEAIKSLVKTDKKFNELNTKGETPLLIALQYEYFEIAKFLINQGINLEEKKRFGKSKHSKPSNYTLLQYLVTKYSSSQVKFLIDQGANVNVVDDFQNTLLHLTAYNKYALDKLIAVLLPYFVNNIDVTNSRGDTPLNKILFLARDKNNLYKAVQLLLKKGANPNIQNYTLSGANPIINAAEFGDVKLMKLLVKYGGDISLQLKKGSETVLHTVSTLPMAKYLLNNGAKKYLNTPSRISGFPLMAQYLSIPIQKLYLKNGANPNSTDTEGNNILSNNIGDKKRVEFLKYLLSNYKININSKNKEGKTAFDNNIMPLSDEESKLEFLFTLIDNGAKFKKIKQNDILSYYKLVNKGDFEALKKLMNSKTYEYIMSEINSQCRNIKCKTKYLKKIYGVKQFYIVKEEKDDEKTTYFSIERAVEGKYSLKEFVPTEKGLAFAGKK